MKTNKEIIIEELKKAHRDMDISKEHDCFIINTEQFASSLLSKLNKLDRGNVEEIANNLINYVILSERGEKANNNILNETSYIDQILSLVPEEGEVVGEGIYNYDNKNIPLWLDNTQVSFEKHKGKKVQIIIREVKE